MKVISLTSTVKYKHTCAAIGIFDGVHRGHQFLLKKMLAKAKALKVKPIVVTFFPHPAHVLRPDLRLNYLLSSKQRMDLLGSLGIDTCVVVRFTKRFAHILPEHFIKDVLVEQLGIKALFVGEDFRFGRDRAGDVALFETLSNKYGYTMRPVKALMHEGEPISSTRIRKLVLNGDLSKAKQMLGRSFSCAGLVVKGKGRGKGLGFPTANVRYDNGIMPPNGVYAVTVNYNKKTYPAIANLGFRPTFKVKPKTPLLEVHLLDFDHDIYGKQIDVAFFKKIRDERSFPSLEALKSQIQKDVQEARSLFKA